MFHKDHQLCDCRMVQVSPGDYVMLHNEAVFFDSFTIYLSVPTLNVRNVLHCRLFLSLLEFPEGKFFLHGRNGKWI